MEQASSKALCTVCFFNPLPLVPQALGQPPRNLLVDLHRVSTVTVVGILGKREPGLMGGVGVTGVVAVENGCVVEIERQR